MRLFSLAALATVAVMPGATAARQANPAIDTAPTVADWSARVGHALERRLETSDVQNGIMSVRFQIAESGRPESLQITMRSGNAKFDRVGKQVVSGLINMHPLPAGIGSGQMFEATIQVSSSQEEFNRQLAKMSRYQALARSSGQQAHVFALGVTSRHPA